MKKGLSLQSWTALLALAPVCAQNKPAPDSGTTASAIHTDSGIQTDSGVDTDSGIQTNELPMTSSSSTKPDAPGQDLTFLGTVTEIRPISVPRSRIRFMVTASVDRV